MLVVPEMKGFFLDISNGFEHFSITNNFDCDLAFLKSNFISTFGAIDGAKAQASFSTKLQQGHSYCSEKTVHEKSIINAPINLFFIFFIAFSEKPKT